MAQTTYNRDYAKAVPGMMSKDAGSFVVSYPAAEDIPPGRIVVLNSDGKVELPQDTTFTKPVGVSVYSPSNMQPAVPAAGFVYKSGDMVPCLRRGRVYADQDGGSPSALTEANVKHSTTVATHRGKVTASATSAGAGTEISDGGPLAFVELGPTGVWLMEVNYPGNATDNDASIAALEADAATANAIMPIPLASFMDADGDPLAKWVDGTDGKPGFTLTDSEAVNIRWNPNATPLGIITQVDMPADMDDTADAQLEFLCSKTGATITDATTFALGVFILSAGDLHDADADAGGTTDALVGNAASKTTKMLTRTIDAANVPAGAWSMSVTAVPTAGTLTVDDLHLHAARLRYKRKIQTS